MPFKKEDPKNANADFISNIVWIHVVKKPKSLSRGKTFKMKHTPGLTKLHPFSDSLKQTRKQDLFPLWEEHKKYWKIKKTHLNMINDSYKMGLLEYLKTATSIYCRHWISTLLKPQVKVKVSLRELYSTEWRKWNYNLPNLLLYCSVCCVFSLTQRKNVFPIWERALLHCLPWHL